MPFQHVIDYGQHQQPPELPEDITAKLMALYEQCSRPPQGIDSTALDAFTEGEEAWFGWEIDKTKFRIVLEDETEESVYLKIVKKEKE